MDEEVKAVFDNLTSEKNFSKSRGFEVYPFNCSTYDETVGGKKNNNKHFTLNYPTNTIGFLIVSLPHMFERTFLPYFSKVVQMYDDDNTYATDVDITSEKKVVDENDESYQSPLRRKSLLDPIDECISSVVSTVVESCEDRVIDVYHDYDLHIASRRPKILMQTVAHISGACYYYQQSELTNDNAAVGDDENWCLSSITKRQPKQLFGVCLHPIYGGWIGLRVVLIFNGLISTDGGIKFITPPKDVIGEKCGGDAILRRTCIENLLNDATCNWKSNKWRDVVVVDDVGGLSATKRYSPLQIEYFTRKPGTERMEFLLKEGKLVKSNADNDSNGVTLR